MFQLLLYYISGIMGRLLDDVEESDASQVAEKITTVEVIRIADFITNVVATRRYGIFHQEDL